ncbi:hypothetical protein HI914_01293 [Erysiphe necator]|uniref:Uncharacterized protein n=1 Tax=Uncinula necator TaxID=52586 RepID=A0A0B1NWH4_UNCNE|nr:hypothetical protein HI914_01293 [Erysiphe necator]KHJ30722.1 hypothetical protein EV44_g3463 [Erysiphe necator]
MTPQIEDLGFEDFGRTQLNRKSCVIGLDDEKLGSKDVKIDRVPTEDSHHQDEPTPKSAKKAHKRGQKALQHLCEIMGRSGKGPINYTKIAEEIRVSVVVDKEKRDNASNSLDNIISYVNMEERAFCVPVVIRTSKDGRFVDVRLPSSVAQADTGSNMVVISYGLIKYINLPMKLLSEDGFSGLTMNVENETSLPLKYFTSFQINFLGISRHIEAFLRTRNSSFCLVYPGSMMRTQKFTFGTQLLKSAIQIGQK